MKGAPTSATAASLPAVTVCTGVDVILIGMLLLKLLGYAIEINWVLREGGAQALRQDYMRTYLEGKPRMYADDVGIGRPRPFTRPTDLDSSGLGPRVLFGYAFKTPALILLSSTATIAVCAWAHPASSIVLASCICALVMVMLATALINRLVLGPLDQLNPDLGVGRFAKSGVEVGSDQDRGVLYPSASSLGRYVLVLIVTSIGGFTAVYCTVSHAIPSAFTEGRAIDPIRWLYFTATIASTVGFGDIHAQSDVGRLLVLLQMAGGTLLITWAATSFFSDGLPSGDGQRRPAPHDAQCPPADSVDG